MEKKFAGFIKKNGMKKKNMNQSVLLIVLIVFICIIATIVNPRFLRISNIINIFQQVSVLGIIACGVGMLLISGDIDISVGAQVSLIGIIIALIFEKIGGIEPGQPNAWMASYTIPLAVVAAFAVGGLLGLVTGITVIKSGVTSFIITLGFSTIYKGIALLISGGASFMLFGQFETLGRGRVLGVIPVAIFFFIGVVILSHIILTYTRYGRFLYALGGNKKASYVSGINNKGVTLRAYVTVGLLNGMAALILISRVGSALATTGESYSLDALAAIIVGGVILTGGKGSALNIFLGVLLIGIVGNALVIMNVNPYLRGIAIGVIIIAAVTISNASGRRS